MFVLPPCAIQRISCPVTGSTRRSRPLFAWFSSERGSPRTTATLDSTAPVAGSRTSRWICPEFVSRPLSSLTEIRQSEDET